jgi:hypothetical protein
MEQSSHDVQDQRDHRAYHVEGVSCVTRGTINWVLGFWNLGDSCLQLLVEYGGV